MDETPNIWADDKLNREPHARFLQDFLIERTLRKAETNSGSYVLNIDAEWGFGKTFFIDNFAKQLTLSGHIVVQINAWKDDYTDDPFVAVLAAIDKALEPYIANQREDKGRVKSAWKTAKEVAAPIAIKTAVGIGKTLFKKYVGDDIKSVIEDTVKDIDNDCTGTQILEGAIASIDKLTDEFAEKMIADFNEQNKAITDFRTKLEDAIKLLEGGVKHPLFVLIDELDRCRPSYAVSLLERVKHLFDASNICFVFATNSSQLQHAITGAYGPNFDGYRYLKRFFERTYTLPTPEPEDFTDALLKGVDISKISTPNLDIKNFIQLTFRQYNSDLREIQQAIDILDTITSTWNLDYNVQILSLMPLILQYIRTGKCDWTQADKNIPSGILLDIKYSNRGGNELLDLKSCFSMLLHYYKTYDSLYNLMRNGEINNVNHYYIIHALKDEAQKSGWRGASKQLSLPTLIQSAGNFS